MFVEGVVGVSDRGAEKITKHARGLTEGYLMLAEILVCFGRIPLKHHPFSIASSARLCERNGPAHSGTTAAYSASSTADLPPGATCTRQRLALVLVSQPPFECMSVSRADLSSMVSLTCPSGCYDRRHRGHGSAPAPARGGATVGASPTARFLGGGVRALVSRAATRSVDLQRR